LHPGRKKDRNPRGLRGGFSIWNNGAFDEILLRPEAHVMKFALFTAAAVALASAPTYSRLNGLFNQNGVLISALAPGTAALFVKKKQPDPTVIALAE